MSERELRVFSCGSDPEYFCDLDIIYDGSFETLEELRDYLRGSRLRLQDVPYKIVVDKVTGLGVNHYEILDTNDMSVGQIYLVEANESEYSNLKKSECYK